MMWVRGRMREYMWRVIVASRDTHECMLNILIFEELVGAQYLEGFIRTIHDSSFQHEILRHIENNKRHALLLKEILCRVGGEIVEVPAKYQAVKTMLTLCPQPTHITQNSFSHFLAVSIIFEVEDLRSFVAYSRALKDTHLRTIVGIIIEEERAHQLSILERLITTESAENVEELFRYYRTFLKKVRRSKVPLIACLISTKTKAAPFRAFSWILQRWPQLV